MGQPSYLCSVLSARAPVLGRCFFVSMTVVLCLAGSPMGQPSYLCSVLSARAPVLGRCFFVSMTVVK